MSGSCLYLRMKTGSSFGRGRHRLTLGLCLFLIFLNFGLVVLLFMLSWLGRGGEGPFPAGPGLGLTWQVTFWLIIATGLIFTIVMIFGVIRPLHLITSSLHEGSPMPLARLVREPTEMGELARLMKRSFEQRDLLESEIAVRRLAEDRVREREAQLTELTRDRERLIHDLHDGLIQSLYAIGLKLELIRSSLDPGLPQAADLSTATGQINQLLTNLRGSLQGSAGLLHRIRSLSRALSDLTASMSGGVSVELDCPSQVDQLLTPGQSQELYAITSEALMNVVRHARARRVRVQLWTGQAQLRLSVEDDGMGMNPSALGGLGLNSMSRRARSIGAKIRWMDGARGGTRVELDMPLGTDAPGPMEDAA
ncbi:MAG: histidine kinase [Candidatus Methylacidiphilales bacterium]|nr:histidine kinase [Candidatus Methylacidiphilales bacterium]